MGQCGFLAGQGLLEIAAALGKLGKGALVGAEGVCVLLTLALDLRCRWPRPSAPSGVPQRGQAASAAVSMSSLPRSSSMSARSRLLSDSRVWAWPAASWSSRRRLLESILPGLKLAQVLGRGVQVLLHLGEPLGAGQQIGVHTLLHVPKLSLQGGLGHDHLVLETLALLREGCMSSLVRVERFQEAPRRLPVKLAGFDLLPARQEDRYESTRRRPS